MKIDYSKLSKDERAKRCNIICPRCNYHNHKLFIKKYGTCHLCGATLDKNYFKKKLQRKMGEL